MKKNDWLIDTFFVLGLAGVGGGIFLEFGSGWALFAVGFILLALSLLGSIDRDA